MLKLEWAKTGWKHIKLKALGTNPFTAPNNSHSLFANNRNSCTFAPHYPDFTLGNGNGMFNFLKKLVWIH